MEVFEQWQQKKDDDGKGESQEHIDYAQPHGQHSMHVVEKWEVVP